VIEVPKPTDGRPWAFVEPTAACRFAVIVLHTSTNQIPDLTPYFQRSNLAACMPFLPNSWWVKTAEQCVVEQVVPWMQNRWNLRPNGIAVLGVEMGGQGAVRLGFKYPELFPVVASLNGAFDFHDLYGHGTPLDELYTSRERARQDTAVLNINPYRVPPHTWFGCDSESEWYRGNDRLDEKLNAYGLAHTANLDLPADGGVAMMMAFVVNALDTLSRKLL